MNRLGSEIPVKEIMDHAVDRDSYIVINDYRFRLGSLRFQTFRKCGISCVTCGITGEFFAIEQHTTEKPHLNLYAVRYQGTLATEVLMTMDHIVAMGDGGLNVLANLQTMCVNCNHAKSSNKQKAEQEAAKRVRDERARVHQANMRANQAEALEKRRRKQEIFEESKRICIEQGRRAYLL